MEADPYYCLYNTKLMNDFIESHMNMYKAMDLQIRFLTSKIESLENEIKELKKES